jgi:hypothetical protein
MLDTLLSFYYLINIFSFIYWHKQANEALKVFRGHHLFMVILTFPAILLYTVVAILILGAVVLYQKTKKLWNYEIHRFK